MSKKTVITITLTGSKKFREFVTLTLNDYIFEGELDEKMDDEEVSVNPGKENKLNFAVNTLKGGEG